MKVSSWYINQKLIAALTYLDSGRLRRRRRRRVHGGGDIIRFVLIVPTAGKGELEMARPRVGEVRTRIAWYKATANFAYFSSVKRTLENRIFCADF